MSKKVLVIGELNVDLIVTGLPTLPALGQELLIHSSNFVKVAENLVPLTDS